MAPVGMVDALGWFSSPEAGVLSLVSFFVLGVALLALCVRCRRNTGNAYDINNAYDNTTTDGANGAAGTKSGGDTDPGFSPWRDHSSMPASTLQRPTAATQ